jgi:drug/metabolite transporter (DMT)-like permease
LRSSLLLLLTSLIWGLAFVAQRSGMAYIGPFLFVALRMLLGAATLLVVLGVTAAVNRRRRKTGAFAEAAGAGSEAAVLIPSTAGAPAAAPIGTQADVRANIQTGAQTGDLKGRRLLLAGLVSGLVLFCSSSFQQIGLVDIDAGKAGFLTALYIVLVPIMGILLHHKTRWNAWVSVFIAVLGLYFLCIREGQSIEFGDLVTLLAAFGWACHILVIDHFVPGISQRAVLKLCVVQFAVAALLALVAFPFCDGVFVSEALSLRALLDAAPAFLYVGVLSTGIAFTLQAVGQQGLTPTLASLIMSLESVFAVIGGMLLLQEMLDTRELIGCALMFIAVVLSQLRIAQNA